MSELSQTFLNKIRGESVTVACIRITCRFTKLWGPLGWNVFPKEKKINIKLHFIYFFAKSHNFVYSREEWFITITANKMFFLALKSDNSVLHGDRDSRNKTPVHHHYYYQGQDEKYCRKHSTFSLLYSCVIIADFGKYISYRKRRMKTLKLFSGRNEQGTLVFYRGNTFLHVLCIIYFLLAL